MSTVVRSGDCGNSPKNQLVENLAVALSMADGGVVSDLVSDDAHWTLVGGGAWHGRDAILRRLEQGDSTPVVRLTVAHVVSHGNSGAADGVVEREDLRSAFCHVFEFTSARGTSVSAITTYEVDL